MMFQVGVFPFARLEDIGATIVELPYGNVRISLFLKYRSDWGKTLINFILG